MTTSKIFIGCISGTSVDGLDLAALALSEKETRWLAATTVDLPDGLRAALLALGQPGKDDLDLLGHTDAALGDFIAEAVRDFIAASNLDVSAVAAIGSHGQTVRHRPQPAATGPAFTMQIGDPNRIAEGTGITTIADFRRRDMAAGGQGAPLVPPFHQHLFRHVGPRPVVVNIGGISNITLLDDILLGFDTGPGNALMDAWCSQHRGTPFDPEGAWAASGTCAEALLEALLQDPYLSAAPPKSTGREHFHLDWLTSHEALRGLEPVDVQTTLAELTARGISDALERWCGDYTQLVICGGGRANTYLMQRLAALCRVPVEPSERWGVDGDSIEAAAFAWLAYRTLEGQSGNAPSVTGADGPRILGALYPG